MGLNMGGEEATYGQDFFAGIDAGSRRSADRVAPLLLDAFSPLSVVDVGGGAGHWAAACLARGVGEVLTIDGPWVPSASRVMPPDRYLEHDLTQPLPLERRFDLALCLEAAEHLPARCAPQLVHGLTELAPVVAFSAAIPGQGGDGHVNEQPASYWARLFAARGYACHLDFRRRIWSDDQVEVWYRQNLLCFVRKTAAARWATRLAAPIEADDPMLDVAHPELVMRHKARADGLEAYAARLEAEQQRLRQGLEQTQGELAQRQADLDRIHRTLAWRALRIAVRPIRRLRRAHPTAKELRTAQ